MKKIQMKTVLEDLHFLSEILNKLESSVDHLEDH